MSIKQQSAACDFGIAHYQEILKAALKSGYKFIRYEDLDTLPAGQKACILRHDIDYIPEWATRLAKIEKDLGIRATYFFEVCAKPYNLRAIESWQVVQEVKELGHALGLHFDLSWKDDIKLEQIAEFCRQEKNVFKTLTGIEPCDIISFHNPHRFIDKILNQDIPGMKHTYEKKYFSDIKYLSDSQGWYEGCVCKIFASSKYPVIQLLTHEYIWPDTSAGDFISDMALLGRVRTDQFSDYMIKFHPVAARHEASLREKIKKAHQ